MKTHHFLLLIGLATVFRADAQTNSWFAGMLNPPKVTPALPANFIVVSASPDSIRTKQFDMYDGVIWSTARTAHQYEFGADQKFSDAQEPLFLVRLSSTIAQKPGTDEFTNEKELAAGLSAVGLKNFKSGKTKWGSYPVLSVTGERSDGSPIYFAWVGINSPDGWTLLIDYRVPKGKEHPTKAEKQIWEIFLKDTKPPK